MKQPIKNLKEIFQNDNRVFIEERLHSETGRVTYGLIATRALNFYELNRMQEAGFYEEFVGSPAAHQIVAVLGHKEEVSN